MNNSNCWYSISDKKATKLGKFKGRGHEEAAHLDHFRNHPFVERFIDVELKYLQMTLNSHYLENSPDTLKGCLYRSLFAKWLF